MNIYIIYKFCEVGELHKEIEKFELENSNDQIFYFVPSNKDKVLNWKEIAEKKIKSSDVVLYLRKETSNVYTEGQLMNISYELELAKNYGKDIIVVELSNNENNDETICFPSIIYEKDFLDRNSMTCKTIRQLDMKLIKKAIFDINEALFPNINKELVQKKNEEDSRLLLEEYKIMLETSEKMMDRRQGTNNFYITLCTGMLTVMVAIIATKTNPILWSCVNSILSATMVFLTFNWKKTLEAYGLSNEAKYEVLNTIEKKLPASIFASEWEYCHILEYSSYSKRESKIPEVFMILFLTISIVMLILCLLLCFKIISFDIFS